MYGIMRTIIMYIYNQWGDLDFTYMIAIGY